jgi:4-amino-4-deoxy-L-arabinose transferase-like glycosyltransferase
MMLGQAELVGRAARPLQWAAWLTIERAAYALVALVALGVRLVRLDAWSLIPAEAAQALSALAATAGVQPDLAGLSPLLYTLQRAVFTLFGATDLAARILPALLGGLSPLLFYALRERLGRGGALAAATLWALSPVAVWSSRLALGDALVPALALAVLAALVHFTRSDAAESVGARGTAAAWLGIALGLLLVSGKNAYTVLLAGAAAALWWPGGARRVFALVQRERKALLTGLAGAALLAATFFFLSPRAFASAIGLAGHWLGGLLPAGGEYSAWDILRRLLISEIALLGFAVAGLVWSIRHRDRLGQWAALAAGVALLFALLGRARHPVDLALVALPLTLLAGPVVSRVLTNAWTWRRETDPWLLVALSLALLFAAAICLPGAFDPRNGADWRAVYTGIGISTALVSVLIWIAYGVYGSWRVVVLAAPVVPLLLGLLWGLSQTASLSFEQGAWRQVGALHVLPATDTPDFAATLRDQGALRGTGAREVNIDVAWPERVNDPLLPVLRWQLRDFPNARFSGALPAEPAPLVITPVADNARLNQGYRGREFALLQRWTPGSGLPGSLGDFNVHLRWMLFREAKTPPEKLNVLLWVQQN